MDSLSPNKCLENIVERHVDKFKPNNTNAKWTNVYKCQMCPTTRTENGSINLVEDKFMCEQCNIYYCETCRDSFHPMRGPLLKHNLVNVAKRQQQHLVESFDLTKCLEHPGERVSLYCLICKCACCSLCVNDNTAHLNHQVQQINAYCKTQKVFDF